MRIGIDIDNVISNFDDTLLKEYFDSLLGYNLYDLFPEIKDNL